jgi:type I restriction enzyme S subunit
VSRWPQAKLGDVAEIDRKIVAPENIQSGTRYVGLEHIASEGYLLEPPIVANGDLASAKFEFTAEHLLYGKLRPYLSKIARPSFGGVCSTDIFPVLPGTKLDRDFLHHFLRLPAMVDAANSRAVGANLPRLGATSLANFDLPLPPLAEQRRIAEVLDRAETLRSQRRQALAQLDALAEAIFLDMFGDPLSNPMAWSLSKLSMLGTLDRGISSTAQEMNRRCWVGLTRSYRLAMWRIVIATYEPLRQRTRTSGCDRAASGRRELSASPSPPTSQRQAC